mmetsp:Transcript_1539/g.4880  ORF Transcript_1539/g.4880 Transcript_1539/m.4880 type:complete len:345 (+) Transcript_1539:460-1494(+)
MPRRRQHHQLHLPAPAAASPSAVARAARGGVHALGVGDGYHSVSAAVEDEDGPVEAGHGGGHVEAEGEGRAGEDARPRDPAHRPAQRVLGQEVRQGPERGLEDEAHGLLPRAELGELCGEGRGHPGAQRVSPEHHAAGSHPVVPRGPVPGGPGVAEHAGLRGPPARVAKTSVVERHRVRREEGGHCPEVHGPLGGGTSLRVPVEEEHHGILGGGELRVEEVIHVVGRQPCGEEVLRGKAPRGQGVPGAKLDAVGGVEAHVACVEQVQGGRVRVVRPDEPLNPVHAHEERLHGRQRGEQDDGHVHRGRVGDAQHDEAPEDEDRRAAIELDHRVRARALRRRQAAT